MVGYFKRSKGVGAGERYLSFTLTEKSNILERQQERLRLDLRKDFLQAKESYKDLRKL